MPFPLARRINVTTRDLRVNFHMAGHDRISDRKSLREEGFIWTHGLKGCQSVVELSLPIKTATISIRLAESAAEFSLEQAC